MALAATGYVYTSIVGNVYTHTSLVDSTYINFWPRLSVIKARKCASALKRNAIKENIK